MNPKHEQPSLAELIDPLHLALGVVASVAFCVTDILWRVLPLVH